jgi:hypothetical protein
VATLIDEEYTDGCQHHVCVRLVAHPPRYLCLICGERWQTGYATKAPPVPPGWEDKPLEELRLWYARAVLKANL